MCVYIYRESLSQGGLCTISTKTQRSAVPHSAVAVSGPPAGQPPWPSALPPSLRSPPVEGQTLDDTSAATDTYCLFFPLIPFIASFSQLLPPSLFPVPSSPSLHPFPHSPHPTSLSPQSPPYIPFPTVPTLHPFPHSPLPASLQSPPYIPSPQSPPYIPFPTVPTLHPFPHSPLPANLSPQSPPYIPFPTVPSLHPFPHSLLPTSLSPQSPPYIPFPTVSSLHPFPHSPLPASLSPQSPALPPPNIPWDKAHPHPHLIPFPTAPCPFPSPHPSSSSPLFAPSFPSTTSNVAIHMLLTCTMQVDTDTDSSYFSGKTLAGVFCIY